MSKAMRNTFSNKNYHEMWCKHCRRLSFYFEQSCAANRHSEGKGFHTCVGDKCPDLMFVDKDGEDWVGYCGATRR